MTLEDEARAELRALEAAGRLRVPRILDGRQGTAVVVDGAEVTSFASNDYLGLAGDRRIATAASLALDEHGVGIGASRLVVGNHRIHAALEGDLASWMRCESARLFNTGYAANVSVLTTLLGPDDVVFSDELDHASIIDGCRLSRAHIVVFPHRDLAALERSLATTHGRRRIVVSETLFSMDGDRADVESLAVLARRYDAALVLDEAHALGVYGPEGRGIAAELGVVPDVVIGTLGKALGTFGAFVATKQAISDLLWNRARPLVFSTGLPPCIPAATRCAVEIVRGAEGDRLRAALHERAGLLRNLLPTAGGAADSPIAPIIIGGDRETIEVGNRLLGARMFVAAVRPPTVPINTARLRISLSAGHSVDEVTTLARLLSPRQ